MTEGGEGRRALGGETGDDRRGGGRRHGAAGPDPTAPTPVHYRSPYRRAAWSVILIGAVAAALGAARLAHAGPDWWAGAGLLLALSGVACLPVIFARLDADAHGLRYRRVLRRRELPWAEIADLRVRLKHTRAPQGDDRRHVALVLRNGRRRVLPLPRAWAAYDPEFDTRLAALRALYQRHGDPASEHLPVITNRSAGRGWLGSALAGGLLLAAATGILVWVLPDATSNHRAWRSAEPCPTGEATQRPTDCLSTQPAVIERTDAGRPRQTSWLYFTDGVPVARLAVSREAAQDFRPGDPVRLTWWHGQVMEVAGEAHRWREHVAGPGDFTMVAAGLLLGAGYPAARLLIRARGRQLPDDEVLPSAWPFVGALVGTAGWLLPLCYLHPLDAFAAPGTTAWAVGGTLASAALLAWAWRATRVVAPADAADPWSVPAPGPRAAASASASGSGSVQDSAEVFLAGRFLEATDYNPLHFGTHLVLGGGPLAVVPHAGPGRFGAKPVPVDRLTVREVRRPRGDEGETVPARWHIAELDDAGRTVRLAAAPDDLARIIHALESTRTSPPGR
ncbi:PH domain-containing protein [Streptomyces sp. DSM 44915]|uniref:PH domain-containing protein n=1 Tax=Streptomyces chisholmiae TaxID=3075540 RepID=A0ABU2JLS6_9ACTN|nr:PH domain-containing protein [Streptomyces sp. DSM 44915]MDT0265701.1 PH domain-containing protein [Streptomyces sp. DSM 44915]